MANITISGRVLDSANIKFVDRVSASAVSAYLEDGVVISTTSTAEVTALTAQLDSEVIALRYYSGLIGAITRYTNTANIFSITALDIANSLVTFLDKVGAIMPAAYATPLLAAMAAYLVPTLPSTFTIPQQIIAVSGLGYNAIRAGIPLGIGKYKVEVYGEFDWNGNASIAESFGWDATANGNPSQITNANSSGHSNMWQVAAPATPQFYGAESKVSFAVTPVLSPGFAFTTGLIFVASFQVIAVLQVTGAFSFVPSIKMSGGFPSGNLTMNQGIIIITPI